MNFIVGHNGSGKSAILTALAICLGGKASSTQRAGSLRGLIRNGTSKATITITIDNSSKNPYNPNVYGNKIIICRSFDQKSSNYKIKNEFNETKFTTRDELNRILDYFQIIIDNPLAILSQDAARSFLTSSNPHSLYMFLSKGINHETWKRASGLTSSTVKETSQSYATLKESMNKIKEKDEKLRKEFKELKEQKEIGHRLAQLVKEIRWKAVENKEREVEKEEKKLKRQQDNLENLERESQNNDEIIKEFDNEESNKTVELNAASIKGKEADDDFKHQLDELEKVESELNTSSDNVRTAKRSINDCSARLNTLKIKLQREIDRIEGGGLRREQEEMRAKQQQYKEKLKSNNDQIDQIGNTDALEEELKKIDDESRQVQVLIQENREKISNIKSDIESTQAASSRFENVFGKKTGVLLAAIEKNISRFSHPPLGPIGRYITIKDKKWAPIVAAQLRRSLRAFVFQNHSDRAIFLEIIRRLRIDSFPTIVAKADLFKFENNMPDRSRFTTLYDILEFSNEHIKRVLIDQHGIEKTILVPNRAEAEAIMFSNPRNVSKCFSIQNERNGFSIGGGTRGASSSAPIFGLSPPYLMRVAENDSSQLDSLKVALSDLQAEGKDLSKQLEDWNSQKRYKEREFAQVEEKISRLMNSSKSLKQQINIIDDKLSEEIDISQRGAIEKMIENTSNDLETYEKQLEKAKEEYDNVSADRNDHKELLKTYQKKVAEVREIRKSINDEIMNIRERKRIFMNEVSNAEGNKAIVRRKMQEQQKFLEETIRVLKELTAQAAESSPDRLVVPQSLENLQAEYTRTGTLLKASQMHNKSRSLDVVAEELLNCTKEFKRAKAEYKGAKFVNSSIDKMQARRDAKYHEFLKQITGTIQSKFRSILKQRDFIGELQINHEEETMIVHSSRKSQDSKSVKDKDIKGLSGGEKSFSQIALLLAVWSAMSCLIRGLDEFDVFMDEVTRSVSMRLMIDAINEGDLSKGQTIFITPNPMTELSNKEHVKIFRLADPKR